MKIYTAQNVYDAALDRVRYLFDEFEDVIVNVSGGKDSTVVRNLALKVAEEKGRLPLKVFFCDLEAEWQTVIDYIREVFSDSRIYPMWVQIPMRLFNASSNTTPYLYCWEDGKQWMREKEPNSIKLNKYGCDRINHLFESFDMVEYPNKKMCRLAGVRTQESTGRLMGLTAYETYKGITWGTHKDKKVEHYTFYPIYDWSYIDVWKAIHDNNWEYCKLYDYMYQYGVPIQKMRISSVIHESAVNTLFYLQEIEGDTWSRLTQRVSGTNTTGQMQKNFYCPKELPFMFKDWWEYRDYLLENVVTDKKTRDTIRSQIDREDNLYTQGAQDDLVKQEINIILNHEHEFVKFSTFNAAHGKYLKNYGIRNRG